MDVQQAILGQLKRIANLLDQRSQQFRIPAIHVTNNGDTVVMSGSNTVTLTTVTLNVPDATGTQKPGYATFPITLTNNDGTAPTLVAANNLVVTTAVSGPNADGSYTGTVTAETAGAGQSTVVNVEADGIVDTVIPFQVVANPDEFASVTQASIVVTPPQ